MLLCIVYAMLFVDSVDIYRETSLSHCMHVSIVLTCDIP